MRAVFKQIITPNQKLTLSAYCIYCNKETQLRLSSGIITEPAEYLSEHHRLEEPAFVFYNFVLPKTSTWWQRNF